MLDNGLMMEDLYSGVILYLTGFSGIGKKTIATEISDYTDMKIVDNTLIRNMLFKVINKKDYVSTKGLKYVNEIKGIILNVITDLSRMQQSYILTDELFENNPDHKKTYEKIKTLAYNRGSTFIPVILRCTFPEIMRRYTQMERSNDFKNVDPQIAKYNFEHRSLMQINHPNLITLDISNLSAKEASHDIIVKAEKIIK